MNRSRYNRVARTSGGFSCLLMIIILIINLTVGAWSVGEILSWANKDIPTVWDVTLGAVIGEISIPVAIVGYILKETEIYDPHSLFNTASIEDWFYNKLGGKIMKDYREVTVSVFKERNARWLDTKWYVYDENKKLVGLGMTLNGAIRDAKKDLAKRKEFVKNMVVSVRV